MLSQVLTGPALAGLITAYVGAINAGAVPTIATAWESVMEQECRRAAAAAVQQYERAFDVATVGADDSQLAAAHRRGVQAAQAAFEEIAIGASYTCRPAFIIAFVKDGSISLVHCSRCYCK